MKVSDFASQHPLAATLGFLGTEGAVLVALAPPVEQIHVLAVLAVGAALAVGQKLILESFIAKAMGISRSDAGAFEKLNGRLSELEKWREAMNCDACAAKSADLERVSRELAEVRSLDAIAAAIRTQTKPLPFR